MRLCKANSFNFLKIRQNGIVYCIYASQKRQNDTCFEVVLRLKVKWSNNEQAHENDSKQQTVNDGCLSSAVC